MTSLTTTAPQQSRGFSRTLAGAMTGAVLEWYDFAVYGALASTVFAKQFFPGGDPRVGLLFAFGTQAIGFLSRPLGGIVFGHLGDRLGRRPTLVMTYVLLGAATAAIGLLPNHAAWGLAAPLALTALRFIQGFALGGEFGAAVSLVSEHATARNRGLWTSFPQTGGPAGTLLATAVLAIISATTTTQQFNAWGWRVAFLLALPMLLIGGWLRRGIDESPHYEKLVLEEGVAPTERGLRQAFKAPRPLLLGLGLRTGENISFYVYSVFVIAYATRYAHFALPQALGAVTMGAICQLVAMIAGGALSDRIGRRPVMGGAALGLALWAPTFFHLLNQGSQPLLILAVCIATTLHGLLAGPEAAWVTELFPTRYRVSGAGVAVQGSSLVGGGPAPLIATALLGTSGQTTMVVAYLVVAAMLSAACVWFGPETRGITLDDEGVTP